MSYEKTEVALLNPRQPYPILKDGGLNFYSRIWPPLDLLNTASLLNRQGISNRLIDAHAKRMDAETTATECKKADKIIISTSTLDRWQCPYPTINNLENLIKKVKEKNADAEITLMGVHGTINPKRTLDKYCADKVIIGDETGAVEAVEGNKKIISSKEACLEEITPDYSGTDPKEYLYEIFGDRFCLLETSRGCTNHCSFCFKKMYGRYREKKPDRVMSELEDVVSKGYTHTYFIDLNFCNNRNRILELCKLMKKERLEMEWTCQTRVDTVDRELLIKMRSAGCKLIHFGIESHSDTQLRAYGKRTSTNQSIKAVKLCKEAGLETLGFFLLGFPGESAKDWKEKIEFAEKLGTTYFSLTIVTPYTEWSAYPYEASYLDGRRLEILKKMIFSAYVKSFLNPGNIGRTLTKSKSGYLKIIKEAITRDTS